MDVLDDKKSNFDEVNLGVDLNRCDINPDIDIAFFLPSYVDSTF